MNNSMTSTSYSDNCTSYVYDEKDYDTSKTVFKTKDNKYIMIQQDTAHGFNIDTFNSDEAISSETDNLLLINDNVDKETTLSHFNKKLALTQQMYENFSKNASYTKPTIKKRKEENRKKEKNRRKTSRLHKNNKIKR